MGGVWVIRVWEVWYFFFDILPTYHTHGVLYFCISSHSNGKRIRVSSWPHKKKKGSCRVCVGGKKRKKLKNSRTSPALHNAYRSKTSFLPSEWVALWFEKPFGMLLLEEREKEMPNVKEIMWGDTEKKNDFGGKGGEEEEKKKREGRERARETQCLLSPPRSPRRPKHSPLVCYRGIISVLSLIYW